MPLGLVRGLVCDIFIGVTVTVGGCVVDVGDNVISVTVGVAASDGVIDAVNTGVLNDGVLVLAIVGEALDNVGVSIATLIAVPEVWVIALLVGVDDVLISR